MPGHGITLYQELVLNFTHTAGSPPRQEILAHLLQAREVDVPDEITEMAGRLTLSFPDPVLTWLDKITFLPQPGKPLWIEYDAVVRAPAERRGSLSQGRGVPKRMGALLFCDPQYPGGVDVFVAWHDSLGKMFFSYAIMIWDLPAMRQVTQARQRAMSRSFILRRLFPWQPPEDGWFRNHVHVSVPPDLAEEMFIWHEMPAVNSPRRQKAIEQTRLQVFSECNYLLWLLQLLSKDGKFQNTDTE